MTTNNENHVNAQQPQKPTLAQRLRRWLNGSNYVPPTKAEIEEAEQLEKEAHDDGVEDSEADGLFVDAGDILFPEEE